MNTNKKGFTLIELLVVIVIIGILATISVATFGGYFAQARDAERQSAVQNISTIMKVRQAVQETVDYATTDGTVALTSANLNSVVLNSQGYSVPAAKAGHDYVIFAEGADFAVAVCAESTSASTPTFKAGTPDGIADVDEVCAPDAATPVIVPVLVSSPVNLGTGLVTITCDETACS